jgi:ubiquinone/menaquinone biosynthesis C-methylase UbiE
MVREINLVITYMAIIDSDTIKSIVKKNFDESSDMYKQFEDKYGLFRFLTLELAEVCRIQQNMIICDIGCGTGTSTLILGKLSGIFGKVIGVDFSEQMLEEAQNQFMNLPDEERKELSEIHFVQCDADTIGSVAGDKVDSVLYNASIFLIPEPENTLKCAYDILKDGGSIGLNYLIGVYSKAAEEESKEPELFLKAKQDGKTFAPYGRRINDVKALANILKNIGFKNISEGRTSKMMGLDELKAFYSIPAQSAALWPKSRYEERMKLLDSLINYLAENNIRNFYQHWGWCTGEK